MTDVGRMSVQELVGKVLADEHADVLRQAVCWLAQELMEAEVSQAAGAGYGERHPDRVARRNGYRGRGWDTRVGSIELAIPRLRSGSYFPSFLEPRRRSEQALVGVVQEAYVNGVSTRKVDRLVEALGLAGVSKDQVSRLCQGLDEQVTAFRERPLEVAYPYLWLDAKVEKVRAGGRVEHRALVVAYGVDQSGQREVIGLDVGAAEAEAFWREFLRSLVRRGLAGVQLVISDAHEGLKQAIAQVLGAPWQRCTVHFLRDALGHCPKDLQQLVGAAIRPIFRAADLEEARRLLGETVTQLEGRVPKVARLLLEAEPDLLGFYSFPVAHRSKLRSTNPLERVNREIGRRTDVVGVFPNDAALLRLAGSLLIEQNDEWLVARRYLSEASMAELITDPTPTTGKMTCAGTPSGSSTMIVLQACWRSSKEVPMGIIGGLDVHRSQITYDWIDTDSGQRQRGQLAPAHREHLRVWLGQFAGQEATFALEGCTGWRYVVEELQRAGIAAHLAEPADTSAARGPKRRAKTDQADARHLRELLATGRLPQSWIPPAHVLEVRTLVRCYKALADEHTAWLQRIHATLFHHGVPAQRNLLAPDRRARLERGSGLSPAAHQLVTVALGTLDHLDAELDRLRAELVGVARRQPGCRALDALYGIGPLTAVAIWAELGDVGRFTSSRQAVRHTGLDVTVYSSDGKRTPGHLARQGPPVLRWALFEAAKCAARAASPDHGYYLQVKGRLGGNRATLSVARKLVRRCYHTLGALGEQAYAPPSDSPDLGQVA